MIVGGESPQMVAVSIAGLFQHLATNWQRFEEFGACFFLGFSSLAWLPFWARFLYASPEPSVTSSFSSSPVTSSSRSSIHNLDVIQIMGQSSSSLSSAAASFSPSPFLGYFIMSTDCNHVSFAIIVQPSPYMMVGLNTMA